MKHHSSDAFRPKLPVDPFTDLDVDQPWLIDPTAQPVPPHVILILGAPSQADLQPLLTSQWLTDSLVLFATHAPPTWMDSLVPTVRILRLQKPLEQGGGRELASLYDRAERLAYQWRNGKLPHGDKKVAQLAEKIPGGEFNVLEGYTIGHAASNHHHHHHHHPTSRHPPKSNRGSVMPHPDPTRSMSAFRTHHSKHTAGFAQDQRTFDAILHFIPAWLPEKDIFKRAILVTTLSISFLSPTLIHQIPSRTTDSTKRRFSSLLRSKHRQSLSYDYSSAPLPPLCYAHLVHILPSSTTPLSLTPSSSSSSISSVPSSQKPPFLSRHLSPSSSSRQSSSAMMGSSSDLDIPNPNPRPLSQPISAPMHAKFVLERQGGRFGPSSSGGRKKLAQSIEQFLLQFTYSSQTAPQPADDLPGSQNRYVPYLLASGGFGRTVRAQGNTNAAVEGEVEVQVNGARLTVGEAIILGLLDTHARGGENNGNNPKSFGKLATRAWIGERQDVLMAQRSVAKPADDALPDPLLRSGSLRVPASVRSPPGKETERAIREDDFFEGLNAILSPRPYPSFQNTPLPWQLPNHGSRSDSTTIKRPSAIVPRSHLPLSPPLSLDEPVSRHRIKNEGSGVPQNKTTEQPTIQWSPPSHLHSDESSLKKLVSILPTTTQPLSDSQTKPDGTESVSSHMARTASTDHSCTGAQGLLTPPESTSSLESAGGSDYMSCEMFSENQHGLQAKTPVEYGPGPFVLFRSTPLGGQASVDVPDAQQLGERLEYRGVGTPDLAGPTRKIPVTSRIGHRFRRLTKVVSLSTAAASSMTSRVVSNPLPSRRTPAARERNIIQAVVV